MSCGRTLFWVACGHVRSLRGDDEVAAMRDQRNQAESVQAGLSAAPQAADAALKVAQIADMGQLAPPQ